MDYIDKISYRSFLECPKKLFYIKDKKEQTKELNTIIFENDNKKVLKEAYNLYPSGEKVEGESPEEKYEETKRLIKEGYETIFGATFIIEGKYLVEVDIFNKKEDRVWELISVKSSPSSEILDLINEGRKPASIKRQMNELAFCSFLMKKLDLEIIPCSINVNIRYKRMDNLDLNKLLFKGTLEKQIKEFELDVESTLAKIEKFTDEEPKVYLGSHCKNPVPCVFKDHCWGSLAEDTIYNIPRITQSKKKIETFIDNGINNVSDMKDNEEMLNLLADEQKIKVKAFLKGKVRKDIMKLTIFLNRIQFPIHYMDFETFSPIVPLYEKSSPASYIPYQYSLHIEEKKDELKHIEFLNTKKEDPRKDFIDSLISNLGEKGSIIVYNRAFEEGILDDMAYLYPEHTEAIRKIKNRIVDIFSPFKEGHYYNPKMIFSNSLKAVLPALVPDLHYKGMDISDGAQAMFMYEQMINLEDGEEKEKIKKDLLAYCGLDTIAMYEILKVLRKK